MTAALTRRSQVAASWRRIIPFVAVAQDSFNRANAASLGTADTGQVWTDAAAAFTINNNEVLLVSGTATNVTAHLELGKANQDVSITARSVESTGVTARVTDNLNFYLGLLASNGTAIIFRKQAGSFTTLNSATTPTPVSGDVCRLTVVGNALTLFRNGVQVVTATDSTFPTQTRCGIYSGNNGSANPRLDNFVAG